MFEFENVLPIKHSDYDMIVDSLICDGDKFAWYRVRVGICEFYVGWLCIYLNDDLNDR